MGPNFKKENSVLEKGKLIKI